MDERESLDLSGSMGHSVESCLHEGVAVLLVRRGQLPEDRLSAVEDGAVGGDGKRLEGAAIASGWPVGKAKDFGGRQVLLGHLFSSTERKLRKSHGGEGNEWMEGRLCLVVNANEWLLLMLRCNE